MPNDFGRCGDFSLFFFFGANAVVSTQVKPPLQVTALVAWKEMCASLYRGGFSFARGVGKWKTTFPLVALYCGMGESHLTHLGCNFVFLEGQVFLFGHEVSHSCHTFTFVLYVRYSHSPLSGVVSGFKNPQKIPFRPITESKTPTMFFACCHLSSQKVQASAALPMYSTVPSYRTVRQSRQSSTGTCCLFDMLSALPVSLIVLTVAAAVQSWRLFGFLECVRRTCMRARVLCPHKTTTNTLYTL